MTDRAFIRVVGVVPRIDVESVSLIWDFALDVPLVNKIFPQLARTVAIGVSRWSVQAACSYHPQLYLLSWTHLFAPGTRHAMPHITVWRSIFAIWRSLSSAEYADGP